MKEEQVKEKVIIVIDFLKHFVYICFLCIQKLAKYFKEQC